MAIRKTDQNQYVQILETDYLQLVKDHMVLKALKIAGIEKMPIFQSVDSIISDGRVEVHIKFIPKRYR